MPTEREIAAAKHAFMQISGANAGAADEFVPLITAILVAAENAREGKFGIKPDTGIYEGFLSPAGS